ncbi:hypothetical protein B2G71_04555 [Novosphingobium sp. PC22D]|uniref:TetR/AcrR family transcriptional regulator n=1 Tax=Novosphingobium sp. PC22D TaxID=1962403 RepID=UPI000BF2470B|nr:TetR family transcriptional regulator C-terminal domain-containing protein [Novosphingobium sp. PC22D]PEQ13608.1 hypothetical protein B2G71_04555 [Novosphingobium sp. PC22D]
MRIDAEQRRRAIAQVTIDLVANEGFAAATFRRIAAEGGWSTASITNYFDDKHDLLVWTFEVLSAEGEVRFDEALRAAGDDPIPPLLTMLPWCPANVRRWKAYLAFWDAAVRDGELAARLAGSTRVGTQLLERLVRRACPDAPDIRARAQRLSINIQGLALHILVDRGNWPEAAIRQTLDDLRRDLLTLYGGNGQGPG